MQAVGAIARMGSLSRVGSATSNRSRGSFSRVGSSAQRPRNVEKPVITLNLVYRFANSEDDAETQARSISQPCVRRPAWKGGGETLKLRVKDPDQATLIIELHAHINGGGPPDDKCTFYGKAATLLQQQQQNSQQDDTDMSDTAELAPSHAPSHAPSQSVSQAGGYTRPSTQETFNRATSAASMATLNEPPRLTGPLPPSTIVIGRVEKSLTEIANQIVKAEQWEQIFDGAGKPAGTLSLKMSLDPPTGIGSSATMGR